MRVSELLTTPQLAERLGVRQTLLRTWRHRGQGPAWSRVGQTVVYREADVAKWEKTRQEKSA